MDDPADARTSALPPARGDDTSGPPVVVAGRYELGGLLGRGAMASVYEAHDAVLGRTVALKLLHPHLGGDGDVARRVQREAAAAARLNHPNIVQVHDRGEHEGLPYVVMECIDGPSLRELLDERGGEPMPPARAAGYADQALAGLGHAHSRGVVHRDVKPHNLLVGSDGRLRVADFGIARATADHTVTMHGEVVGTPHYSSPEQAQGERVGPPSDLYSMGVVLYELLRGQLPFAGGAPVEVLLRHVDDEPEPPSSRVGDAAAFGPALDAVVLRALAKQPAARFADAGEFRAALARAVEAEEVGADDARTTVLGAVAPTRDAPGSQRRVGWAVLLPLLLVAALVMGLLAFGRSGGDAGDVQAPPSQEPVGESPAPGDEASPAGEPPVEDPPVDPLPELTVVDEDPLDEDEEKDEEKDKGEKKGKGGGKRKGRD